MRAIRVGAMHEEVAAGRESRDVQGLAVEERRIAVDEADGGPFDDASGVGLSRPAVAEEARWAGAGDPWRHLAPAIDEAEPALAVADEQGEVAGPPQLVADERLEMPVVVRSMELVVEAPDIAHHSHRPAAQLHHLVGDHRLPGGPERPESPAGRDRDSPSTTRSRAWNLRPDWDDEGAPLERAGRGRGGARRGEGRARGVSGPSPDPSGRRSPRSACRAPLLRHQRPRWRSRLPLRARTRCPHRSATSRAASRGRYLA